MELATSVSWSSVSVGCDGAADLACFLALALTKEQQAEWTRILFDAYYVHLTQNGVDGAVCTKQWFERDYQTMLWEIVHARLLAAGRMMLQLPKLGSDTRHIANASVSWRQSLPHQK